MAVSRVLMVSKFRRITGGVEKHIESLSRGLIESGIQVECLTSEDVDEQMPFSTDQLGARHRAVIASKVLWNRPARRALNDVVNRFEPDLIHYHSIYHQLSPSVVGNFGVPNVMTLHDYKLAAPCYTLVRDGQVCQECVGRTVAAPAIRHACISGSRIRSALCVAEDLIHTPRYRRHIDQYVAPSEFAAEIARTAGVNPIRVIPWGVAVRNRPVTERRRKVVYAGRLHETKGVRMLLDAWDLAHGNGRGWELCVLGDGELMSFALDRAKSDPSIRVEGPVGGDSVQRELADASLSVVPSIAPETMGLSALESLLLGTPLVVSGSGALLDLAGPGVVVATSSDVAALGLALSEGMSRANELRRELASRDLTRYRESTMISAMRNLYEEVLARSGA